jgi:RPA family protein
MTVLLPGYLAMYYMDGSIQVAIESLETTAKIMKEAGNVQVMNAAYEAISAWQAIRASMNEVKLENNAELAQLQAEAQKQTTTDTTLRFGETQQTED